MKCFLHIGTAKTGTTLLQKWLYKNKGALDQQGVFLSSRIGSHNNRLLPAYFNSELDEWAKTKQVKTLEEKARFFDRFEERLGEEIATAAQSHDTFVMTSEHLSSRVVKPQDIARLRDFLAAHFSSVTVICYFRSQMDMALSAYSTAVKAANAGTLEKFMTLVTPENYFFNFEQIADQWSDAFGKENCVFRIYDRARFTQGDIRHDFLECLGRPIDATQLDFDIETANESLSRLSAVAYRKTNELVPHWVPNDGGINQQNLRLKTRFAQLDSLRRGRIGAANKQEILDTFRPSNTAFFQKYFGTENQFETTADSAQPAETFSIEEVEQIIDDVLSVALDPMIGAPATGFEISDAKLLRQIARKIRESEPLSKQDARALMQLARRSAKSDG